MMKKLIALFLCLMLALPMGAALANDVTTELTLWTFPVGGFGDDEQVQTLIADFNAVYPHIKVNVEYLDYTNGDVQVTTAMEAKTTPDIIFEGPERLVAVYAAAKALVPLDDLWTDEAKADISAGVAAACMGADGVYYEYPLCSTAHCMVINKTAFEKADAMQYIDMEKHTWTTEDFEMALRALVKAGYSPTGLIFCSGQGGDQGTRALVNNLYSGKFTTPDFSQYTMNSEENIKALTTLQTWASEGLITFDPSINGGEEIALFVNGTSQMAFCWNAAIEGLNRDKLADGIELFPMTFPTDKGDPELCGGIWGFGVFDNGSAEKIEAAKTFIRFMCDDPQQVRKSVYLSGYFSVRASVTGLYAGTEKEYLDNYAPFVQYLGDYYQTAPNWTVQRYEWWNLLQRIGAGGNVADEVAMYIQNVNQ